MKQTPLALAGAIVLTMAGAGLAQQQTNPGGNPPGAEQGSPGVQQGGPAPPGALNSPGPQGGSMMPANTEAPRSGQTGPQRRDLKRARHRLRHRKHATTIRPR